MHNLGQAVAYAVEACKRQFRQFIFSISISGSFARFIRWDRAGAIISESFNIREKPQLLCRFLWYFSQLTDAQRGYDLTVQPASDTEEKLFRETITAHIKTQLSVNNEELEKLVAEHYEKGAVTVIHLPPESDPANISASERYIVSRPIVIPLSVAGRGTRTYWAVRSIASEGPGCPPAKVVLLKDTWRYGPLVPGEFDCEGKILRELGANGIRNVPRVLYHADVPNVDVQYEHDAPSLMYRGNASIIV